MVPPLPISDYGTGCMEVVAALTGLYHRATSGGSYYDKVSLLQYDLLLFEVGQYPESVQRSLLKAFGPELQSISYHESVDQIS